MYPLYCQEQLQKTEARMRELEAQLAGSFLDVGDAASGGLARFYREYKHIFGQKYWEYMGRQITEIPENAKKYKKAYKTKEKP